MPKKSETVQKKKRYSTPGGLTKIAYHRRKHIKHHCSMCNAVLSGMPTVSKSLSKSEKVPNRPFGGVYCSACTRKFLRSKIIKMGENK